MTKTPTELAAPAIRSIQRAADDAHLLAELFDGWLDDLDRIGARAHTMADSSARPAIHIEISPGTVEALRIKALRHALNTA